MEIRILICDDQAIVRDGLVAMLGLTENFQVVGVAANGKEAFDLVGELRPNIILLDLKMPKMDGIQATRLIREHYPSVAILILTTYATNEWVQEAIRAGANGYLLKDTRRNDLVRAIEGTIAGQTFLDPQVAGVILKQARIEPTSPATPLFANDYGLTEREREILRLIAEGKSNPEIGRILHLSSGTIRNYLGTLFAKLDINDRVQAAVIAVKIGVV